MPRARYRVDRDGNLVERKTGERMVTPDRIACPMLMRDVAYKSPLSRKEITSRSQRRDEMARFGVREVEPSEFRPTYNSRKWAERMKGDHDPVAMPTDYLGDGYRRPSRDQLPAKIRRSLEPKPLTR